MVDLSRVQDACACRNKICPLTLLIIGIAMGITGCVVASVGFGTMPKDLNDSANQAMRIAGLILIGLAVLPLTVSTICWIFYCFERRAVKKGGYPLPNMGTQQVYTDKIALATHPPISDENDENVLFKYPLGGQQSSASDSSYSERYASQYRASDATKIGSLEEDDPRKKPLSAVNEVDDDFSWFVGVLMTK